MTIERAIALLETGSRFPDTPHTAQEIDEACALAVKALRAQQEPPNEPLAGVELAKMACALNELKKYQALGALNEFTDYIAAEEQGLLVRLPCKEGTTVYWLTYCNGICPELNNRGKCLECTVPFSHKYSIKEKPFRSDMLYRWNKDYFLTREEAEAALKEANRNRGLKIYSHTFWLLLLCIGNTSHYI